MGSWFSFSFFPVVEKHPTIVRVVGREGHCCFGRRSVGWWAATFFAFLGGWEWAGRATASTDGEARTISLKAFRGSKGLGDAAFG